VERLPADRLNRQITSKLNGEQRSGEQCRGRFCPNIYGSSIEHAVYFDDGDVKNDE